VRPAPEHPVVEIMHSSGAVDRRERVVRLGQLDDSYRLGTLATADAALQTLIEAGRFVRECAETFTFLYHFDRVETWLAYMAEHWSTAHISAQLIGLARRELSAETSELRILRAIQAARLRRT
jgi:hypothetical protein